MAVSQSTEKISNIIVSLGAAVVIFGAWAKILHLSFADLMLTIGLLTEAGIFLVYAYLSTQGYGLSDHGPAAKTPAGTPALASLDKMLQDAEITPASLRSLSDNFQKLNATAGGMKDVTDVVAATGELSTKTKEAAHALGGMKDAYQQAASSVASFNSAAEGTKQFHEQVQNMTKNLSSLNTIYELELQDTNNHLKAMNKFYGNLVQASEAMQGSVDDAKRAHDQIASLAKNLGTLNNIYGNMINAMQGR
ncbi:MAG TPA: gliding motility protein GldL [Lacibacter sp.]|nr:gliding motility protein GldL [Lacibacter sp.]HMO88709.1 gliding motility protein GldL [Lacibacter sp.]